MFFIVSCKNLPDFPETYVHKCSLFANVPDESKCASSSGQCSLWASCGTVQVEELLCFWSCIAYCKNIWIKSTEMWLRGLNEQYREHWKFERLEEFLYKKIFKHWWAIGKNLGKYWQDYIVGNIDTKACWQQNSHTAKLYCAWRPWECQMLTWTRASFIYYSHMTWFKLFGVILSCYVTICVLAW